MDNLIPFGMASDRNLHPIGFVARQTGLTTHIIRVWERRYEAIVPTRTETNRRLYSDDDIERLRLLKKATAMGHAISRIAGLEESELRGLVTGAAIRHASESRETPDALSTRLLERCRAAIPDLDRSGLENALREASIGLSPPYFFEHMIVPLMRWVGEEWHAGRLHVGQEHFATAVVRGVVQEFGSKSAADGLPAVVIATPAGNQHEVGALLAAGTAALQGWRDIYLGANVPARDLARSAIEQGASAVGLSVVYLDDPGRLLGELRELTRALPAGVPVIIGGDAVQRHAESVEKLGVRVVRNLSEFRSVLQDVSESFTAAQA